MAKRTEEWEGMYQNLIDAGCSQETARQCISFAQCNRTPELLRVLSCHRALLLDAVHENQKKIDCLDFLLYQMNKRCSR